MSWDSSTREQIKNLFSGGYYFRKKNVKGRVYITARKGSKEKSLGAFKEGNWEYIRKLTGIKESSTESKQGHKRELKSWDLVRRELEEVRGELQNIFLMHKISDCIYRGEDGYCKCWRFLDQPSRALESFLEKIRRFFGEDVIVKVEEADGSKYWVFKAIGLTCRDCVAFMDGRMLNIIKKYLH